MFTQETQEYLGMTAGIFCLIPMFVIGLMGFLSGFLDRPPRVVDENAQWEQNVRDMYKAYQDGDSVVVRQIRDSMDYPPPGHQPSPEALEALGKMGKNSGY